MAAIEPVLGYLRWRVVNWQTGAEIIANLPHLHQSTYTVRGFQAGAPATSCIGDFKIPLFPPTSDGYAAAEALYDQLDYGLRVEAYMSSSGDAAGLIGFDNTAHGKIAFGGIIRNIKKTFTSFEISGFSDIWVMQSAKCFPSEVTGAVAFNSTTFVQCYLGNNYAPWVDEFNPYTSANYTSLGGGTWTGTTADLPALSCVQVATGTNPLLLTTSAVIGTLANGVAPTLSSGPAVAFATGLMTTTSTDASNAGQAGVVIGTAVADNIQARAILKWVAGTSSYSVDVAIHSIVATVDTTQTASNVITGLLPSGGTINFRFQIALVVLGSGQGTRSVNVVLNGLVVTFATQPTTAVSAAQSAGLTYLLPTTGSMTASFFQLAVLQRNTQAYSAIRPIRINNIDAGSEVMLATTNNAGQSFLDMLNMAATAEGYTWLYSATAVKALGDPIGSLDYQAAPGVDRSTILRFEEGGNLIDGEVVSNGETLSSVIRVNGTPAAGGASFVYFSTAGTTKYGALEDNVASLAVSDFAALKRYGLQIGTLRNSVGVAKSIKVLRDPATADVWREQDSITVHSPTLGLLKQKCKIIAYDFTEGSPTQTLWLDQYGELALISAARFTQAAQYVAGQFKAR